MDGQIVRIVELVERDQPGPGRAVAVARLAEAPLRCRALALQHAIRQILTDRVTGDVRHCVRRSDVERRGVQIDYDELDLPVGIDRQLNGVRRADDAARPFGEHRRLLRHAEDALLGMRLVVEADRKDLRWPRHRRVQLLRRRSRPIAAAPADSPHAASDCQSSNIRCGSEENRLSLAVATSTTAPSTNVLSRPARLNSRMNAEHMHRQRVARLSTVRDVTAGSLTHLLSTVLICVTILGDL